MGADDDGADADVVVEYQLHSLGEAIGGWNFAKPTKGVVVGFDIIAIVDAEAKMEGLHRPLKGQRRFQVYCYSLLER